MTLPSVGPGPDGGKIGNPDKFLPFGSNGGLRVWDGLGSTGVTSSGASVVGGLWVVRCRYAWSEYCG